MRDSRTKRVRNTGTLKTTPLTKVSNVELPKRVGFLTIISWMMMFDTNSVYVFTGVSNLVINVKHIILLRKKYVTIFCLLFPAEYNPLGDY